MATFIKRPLVFVIWEDITTYHLLCTEREAEGKPAMLWMSVGWIIKRDNEYIRITPMRSEDDNCTDITVIPACCVTLIQELEIPKKAAIKEKNDNSNQD